MTHTFSFRAMNVDFSFTLPPHCAPLQPMLQQWLLALEKQWSRFNDTNELAQINRLAIGETMQISPLLYTCLQSAHKYYLRTNGLFSPYLRKQMVANGYVTSFPFRHSALRTLPKPETALSFLPQYTVQKYARGEVDLGGFAKGFLIDQLCVMLKNNYNAEYGQIIGGDDMRMWSTTDKVWSVTLNHPTQQVPMTSLRIKNGAVATSSRLQRQWQTSQDFVHHILNGQTGLPAQTDIVQATFICDDLTTGEVGAKLSFLTEQSLLGPSSCYIVKADGSHNWQQQAIKKAVGKV